MIPLVANLFLFLLLQHAFCIDYFDQSVGGRQRIPSGLGTNDQQRQQQQQPQNPFLQTPNAQQQQPPFGGNPYQRTGQANGQQQQSAIGTGNPFGTNIGQPRQQQHTGISFGNALNGQRQNEQYEFGRGLQQQQLRNSSQPFGFGPNPNSNQDFSSGGSFGNPNFRYSGGNVLVEVNLRSFTNPNFKFSDGNLCTCPDRSLNSKCVLTSPQRNGYNCLTSLTVFVLSADNELRFNETVYAALGQQGQLSFEQLPPFQFTLDSQPSAIAILAHNLGAKIDPNGNLIETNSVTIVDSFTHDLEPSNSITPYGSGSFGQQSVSIQGTMQSQTQVSFSYTISCKGARGDDGKPLIGPGCDLSCNTSIATQGTAICVSRKTGYFSQCQWAAGNSQVRNCQNCPWGIKEDAYCADEKGGVLQPDHAGVVSSFYYKAFIVLCCLCVLLLFCFVVVCLLSLRSIMKTRRGASNNYRAPPRSDSVAAAAGFNSTTSRIHRGDAEATVLNSAFGDNKAPPPYSNSYRSNGSSEGGVHASIAATAGGPLPVPRSNASTASAAGSEMGGGSASGGRRFPALMPPMLISSKSGKTLSPPRYQPLPHLGINAGNDSLNSSFAGMPPPSVSADV